jgi:hypothetical protein
MPSLTVSLTSKDTNYNLYDLVTAVSGYSQAKPSARELTLTLDPGVGGAKVRVGDGLVSDTNFGVELTLAGIKQKSWQTGTSVNGVSLVDKFLRADSDSTEVNVDFEYA